jgi:hypothetical protein
VFTATSQSALLDLVTLTPVDVQVPTTPDADSACAEPAVAPNFTG